MRQPKPVDARLSHQQHLFHLCLQTLYIYTTAATATHSQPRRQYFPLSLNCSFSPLPMDAAFCQPACSRSCGLPGERPRRQSRPERKRAWAGEAGKWYGKDADKYEYSLHMTKNQVCDIPTHASDLGPYVATLRFSLVKVRPWYVKIGIWIDPKDWTRKIPNRRLGFLGPGLVGCRCVFEGGAQQKRNTVRGPRKKPLARPCGYVKMGLVVGQGLVARVASPAARAFSPPPSCGAAVGPARSLGLGRRPRMRTPRRSQRRGGGHGVPAPGLRF